MSAALGQISEERMLRATVGGPGLMAVGSDSVYDFGWDPAVWTSPDGLTWTRVPGPGFSNFYSRMLSVTVGSSGLPLPIAMRRRLRSMSRGFQMIDVFGSGALLGNPLAVVHDAEGLTTEEMQAITRWMNLSETTFLLPPTREEADYRVRIFTPIGELPFCRSSDPGDLSRLVEHRYDSKGRHHRPGMWYRSGSSEKKRTALVCGSSAHPERTGR